MQENTCDAIVMTVYLIQKAISPGTTYSDTD